MGRRLGALALLAVLLAVGILLGSSLAQWWQEAPAVPIPATHPMAPGHVRVEVLNGGGLAGVAREATTALRDLGYDVVYYGNAGTFSEDLSVVMDRVGRVEAARLVADALGIRQVVSEPDSNLYVDVTVRLGPDWSPPDSGVEEGESPPPWWDLRRFFRRGDGAQTNEPTGR